MKRIVLLLFFPFLTAAYNLDTQNVFIYEDPARNNKNNTGHSFFGYSVLLAPRNQGKSDKQPIQKFWLLVGAPKANYITKPNHGNNKIPKEPGAVYRCTDKCVQINVTNPDDEIGFIDQVALHTLIEKGHAWFGAAMTFHKPTDSLTVCAPRTIVRIFNSSDLRYQNTMQGACYSGNLTSGNLGIQDKNFSTYDFDASIWHNPLNGFAVHYPTPKVELMTDVNQPIIGSPKHQLYGSVHKMGDHKTTELPTGDDLNQFGYALTSGYYFHAQQLMIAGGAPGWQYLGQVAVMDPRTDPLSIIATIDGKKVGEYFGSSLTTGDINKDGLDDLIVGAPHWKNDNGRVHIFLGNKAGFFEADVILEGKVEDALFGYALASGDLDGDGFDDLIIGAPWEESGVIYVYNGDAEFRDIRLFEPSQRVSASDLRIDIRRFGFSLSKPLDINGDDFADIAVGAYGSGHVVILRSKPSLKTRIVEPITVPNTLLRNATSFILQICSVYEPRPKDPITQWPNQIDVTVDEDHKRVTTSDFKLSVLPNDDVISYRCKDWKVYLKRDIRNYVDPIEIVAKHIFTPNRRDCEKKINPLNQANLLNLCPIPYKNRDNIVRAKISFDIGCGFDEICHAFIRSELNFPDLRNSTWIIGSDDLRLELQIMNEAEPAYLTTVEFYIPIKIRLRSLLPVCKEEKSKMFQVMIVTCDVGNPLESKKTIVLDLDMNGMQIGSLDGRALTLSARIRTESDNLGNPEVSIKLHLKANVSVSLSGKASDNTYFLKNDEKPKNLTLQHAYQISKFGKTPISMAFLTILVPFKRDGLEFLTIGQKPRVSILGGVYECSMTNFSIAKPRSFDNSSAKTRVRDFDLNPIADHLRIRRQSSQNNFNTILRTDPNPSTTLNYSDLQSDGNVQPQIYAFSNSDVDVHYVNCSTPGITCGQIFCMISTLKTDQDVGKLQIQMIVDNSILAGDADDREKVIHVTTEAFVEVVDPKMSYLVTGAGIIVPVTTTIIYYPAPIAEVSIWIILGSIFLGLLALCLIAIGLRKIGFFKRHKKEELEVRKNKECMPLQYDSFAEGLDDADGGLST